jgi:hypothetical protein
MNLFQNLKNLKVDVLVKLKQRISCLQGGSLFMILESAFKVES